MFLLDTDLVSEMRKLGDGRADIGVTVWVRETPSFACHLSAITVMELEIGVCRLERRDPAQGARLRGWLDDLVLPVFANRILPVDRTVALRCARLHVPDARCDRDALIAATA